MTFRFPGHRLRSLVSAHPRRLRCRCDGVTQTITATRTIPMQSEHSVSNKNSNFQSAAEKRAEDMFQVESQNLVPVKMTSSPPAVSATCHRERTAREITERRPVQSPRPTTPMGPSQIRQNKIAPIIRPDVGCAPTMGSRYAPASVTVVHISIATCARSTQNSRSRHTQTELRQSSTPRHVRAETARISGGITRIAKPRKPS